MIDKVDVAIIGAGTAGLAALRESAGRGPYLIEFAKRVRTALAVSEIRMRLPERFRNRLGGPQRNWCLDHLLQRKTPLSSHGLLMPTEVATRFMMEP